MTSAPPPRIEKVIRVVLDTNVLVSALVFGGVPRAVLEVAEAGRCGFFYSRPIQTEVRRVLAERFDWSHNMLRSILPVVWSIGKRVTPRITVNAIPNDPDDNRILECAMAAHAQFVSGDHHLLDLLQVHLDRERASIYRVSLA